MKRISLLILLFLIFACSRARKESNMMEDKVLMETQMGNAKEDFEYQNLSEQKVQDLFDLLLLQKKYPEFNKDIVNQIKEISKDSIYISNNIDSISIENIKIIEPIKQLSDTIQSLKIDFDIISNLGTSQDSLIVIIKIKKIVLDNDEFESTKLTLKKIN